MHNYPLFIRCLLEFSIVTTPKHLGSDNNSRPKLLGSTTMFGAKPRRGSDIVARPKWLGSGNLVQVYCGLRHNPMETFTVDFPSSKSLRWG